MQLHGEARGGDGQAAALELGEVEATGGDVAGMDRAGCYHLATTAVGRQADGDLEGDGVAMQDDVAQELEALRLDGG